MTNATKPLYQVLLLDNNTSQDVSVQEADQVDFCAVKEHLQNGGSVFITSTDSQKNPVSQKQIAKQLHPSNPQHGFYLPPAPEKPLNVWRALI